MSRNRSALLLLLVGALAVVPLAFAGSVSADTATYRDPTGPRGAQDIVSVTADNTGHVLSVTVRTRGTEWRGRTDLYLDVRGGRRYEHVVTISRTKRGRDTFTNADGSRWRCDDIRTRTSPLDQPFTKLTVSRDCLAGLAPKLRVMVKVRAKGARDDTARTRAVPQQSRPNILMFMVDDMRADDLQYMPQVKSLIGDQGVTWANSFAPYPLCCPARASVMTGMYAHNHHVWSHLKPWGFHAFDDHSTVATWLKASGYHTSYLGKYLNGYGDQPKPNRTRGHSTQYVPPGWQDWKASIDGGLAADDPNAGGTYRYFDTTLNDNGHGYQNFFGSYQTKVYGRIGARTVRREALSDTPFFSYISFTAPHHGMPRESDDPAPVERTDGEITRMKTPARPAEVKGMFDDQIFAAPGAFWLDPDNGADKPDDLRFIPPPTAEEQEAMLETTRQRAESLAVVDDAIAKIMESLRSTGELEKTLVVFTSDNGYFLGEQGIRQGKILPYEPSLRTPTLMRGPGIPAGEVRNDPFLSIDFAPTFAELGDATPASVVDGRSMLDVARTGDLGWKRIVLTETGPAAVVRDTDESGQPIPTDDPGQRDLRYLIGIRTARYLYTDRATGEEELYDLSVDPEEYTNVIDRPGYRETSDLMRKQLARIRACDGRSCRVRLPASLATSP